MTTEEKIQARAEQKTSEYLDKLYTAKDQAKKEVENARNHLRTIEDAINWTEMMSSTHEGEIHHPFWQEAEKEIEEEEE